MRWSIACEAALAAFAAARLAEGLFATFADFVDVLPGMLFTPDLG
jgi:hypothetical protein